LLETCAIPLSSALLIGFVGSSHCIGMCGGIAAALDFALPADTSQWRKWRYRVYYSLGRIVSYAMAGAIVGSVGAGAYALLGANGAQWLRIIAGVFMVVLGITIAGWLNLLVVIEQGGSHLWRRLAPLQKRLFPVNSPIKALALGGLWGWLPCGLVYSTLAWAMASGTAWHGGLVMLAFGVGTLPAVLLMGRMAQSVKSLSQKPWLRRGAGIFIILFGLWTIIPAIGHLQAGHHHPTPEINHNHDVSTANH